MIRMTQSTLVPMKFAGTTLMITAMGILTKDAPAPMQIMTESVMQMTTVLTLQIPLRNLT